VNALTYGLPVRLVISKINVDTDILPMGVTSLGNMQAPKTNKDSGWYKYGPHPGNVGSAVIAGHLGVGSAAVFTKLGLLVKGDIISVKDDRSQIASFVVTDTRSYDRNSDPSEVFTSSTGSHLNLITCNGDWNPEIKTYSQRLVVFTDRL
jgi:sortase A